LPSCWRMKTFLTNLQPLKINLMSKTLYIIGNGFDLHHGLKTSYYDFAQYLKTKDSNLYDLLEKYIAFAQSDKDLWGKFEENLAGLDADQILEDNKNYLPNIASDAFRSGDMHVFPDIMDGIFINLTTDLIEVFQKFILDVEIPKSVYEKEINIDKNSLFLSFNYTNTLETIYKIEPKIILYIHNSPFYRYDSIILGHGMDPESFKEKAPHPPEGLTKEEEERWQEEHDDYDYSYDTGKENLMKYFSHSYKPTKEIISKNKSFFSKLGGIDNIFILGHSLSSVDIPYFEEIVKSASPNVHWTVSYYYGAEKETHLIALTTLGIKEENITFVELQELQKANNQLKIDLE